MPLRHTRTRQRCEYSYIRRAFTVIYGILVPLWNSRTLILRDSSTRNDELVSGPGLVVGLLVADFASRISGRRPPSRASHERAPAGKLCIIALADTLEEDDAFRDYGSLY